MKPEEFLVGEAFARLRRRFEVVGVVRLLQRLAQRRVVVAFAKGAGKRLGQRRAGCVERGLDPAAEHALRDLFGEGIDGYDAAGVEKVVFVAGEDFVVGVLEREAFIGAGRAREQDLRAGREGPREKTPPEPGRLNLSSLVLEEGFGEVHAAAQSDCARGDDLGLNGDRIAAGDLVDGCRVAPVLIVPGKMEQEVAQGEKAEVGQ